MSALLVVALRIEYTVLEYSKQQHGQQGADGWADASGSNSVRQRRAHSGHLGQIATTPRGEAIFANPTVGEHRNGD